MPNWCENRVQLRGKPNDLIAIRDLLKSKDSDLSFDLANVIPETYDKSPDKNEGAFPAWYNWRIENWGTKWNTCENDMADEYIEHGELSYRFLTAWSPPIPVYEELTTMFPNVLLSAYMEDEGGFFAGYELWKNGKLIKEADIAHFVWPEQALTDKERESIYTPSDNNIPVEKEGNKG